MMKKVLQRLVLILGLVLGIASQTANAQVEVDPTSPYVPKLRNTQSDYFAYFNGMLGVTVEYVAANGSGYASFGIPVSNATFAPSGQSGSSQTYSDSGGMAAAQDDAAYRGLGEVYYFTVVNVWIDWAGSNYEYRVTATPPTSANYSVPYGTTWAPTLSGGSGGTPMWVVGSVNNWTAGTHAMYATPGTYQMWVGVKSAPGYEGNVNDPIQGRMMIDPTPYTVTIY